MEANEQIVPHRTKKGPKQIKKDQATKRKLLFFIIYHYLGRNFDKSSAKTCSIITTTSYLFIFSLKLFIFDQKCLFYPMKTESSLCKLSIFGLKWSI